MLGARTGPRAQSDTRDSREGQDGEVRTALNALVAEDTAVNQRVISQLLHTFGHATGIAHHGREALDANLSFSPDRVCSHVRMQD